MTTAWIKLHTNLHNVCSSPNICRMIKSQQGQEIHTEFHLKKQIEHLADLGTPLRPTVKFTMELKTDSAILFLNMLVIRKGSTLGTKFYRKTHWPLPPSAIESSTTCEKRNCTETTPELPPYAKSNKTALMKLIFQDISHWVYRVSYQQIEDQCSSEEGASTSQFYVHTVTNISGSSPEIDRQFRFKP